METAQTILYILIAIMLVFTIVYSVRYRKQKDAALRGVYMARMNMFLGGMLVLISIIQFFLFAPSTTRIIVGLAFFLLGLFNLFSGVRNHAYFSRQQ